MLYHYTLFPLEKFLSILLSVLHGFTGSYLLALILLSIVVRLITAPLEKLASKSAIKEHDITSVLAPQIAQVKAKFKGGERHEAIKRLYTRYSYHPIYALRSMFGLLVQLPFFIAAFYMIGESTALQGIIVPFIGDLGQQDKLLWGTINLLPFIMTGVNLLALYTNPNFNKKESIQGVCIALLFLILLYSSPAALLIYWTVNQAGSLAKNIIGKFSSKPIVPQGNTRAMKGSYSRFLTNFLKRHSDVKENLVYSGFTSLVTSLILSLIFPLQLYVQTQKYLHFTIWSFLSDCLILFLIILSFVFLLLFFLRRIFGFLIHLLVLAMLLYLTLETGVLAYSLPKLDGNLENYSNMFRMLLDSAIALSLLLLPFLFYEKLRKKIFFLGVSVLILSVTFFLDFQTEKENKSAELIIPSTVPQHRVVQSLRYAKKKNTIILIVDAISTEVVENILNDHPELKEKMPGFINFTNNVGMHVQTSVAIPGIFSGEYFSNPHELNLYSNKVYSSSSFIKKYKDLNSSIFINLLLPDFSYTNKIDDVNKDKNTSIFFNSFTTRMEGMFPFNIMEYYIFKISPYPFKRGILEKFLNLWESQHGESYLTDEVVYAKIAEALVDKSIASSLHVHHFKGGHPPLVFDENGVKIKNTQLTYQAYYNRVHFEFKRLTGLFDRLRERGLYDDSFILILGDHGIGIFDKPKSKNVPNKAFPAILVKNRNTSKEFINNSISASHSKISSLIKKIANVNISDREILQILQSDKRLYRQAFQNKLQDYIIDQNYNVEIKQYVIEKDPLKLRPLNTNYTYRFKSFNNPNYPDFVTNGSRTSGVGLDFYKSQTGELIFRLPTPNFRYSLHFNVVPWGNISTSYDGAYHFISENFKMKHSFQSREDIVLTDLLTDDNGIVRLSVVPMGTNYHLAFFSIRVEDATD